jgi:UDP-N-acetylglucosamine/UDP-N-acetylgalactosamine diphosphorylase
MRGLTQDDCSGGQLAFTESLAESDITFEPVEQVASTDPAAESFSAASMAAWSAAGLQAVAQGTVAVLTLAGGQGTRLGFDKPKGMYNLRLPSQKTLFHLQADRIHGLRVAAASAAGVPLQQVHVPWVIMTSPMTHADTEAYFQSKAFFGMPKDSVLFFSQGTLPCLTFKGKIILQDASTVAQAPDGNGGIYRALHVSGTYDTLKAAGVQHVHVFAVDNALVKVGDPVFVGYCAARGAEVGAKVCRKSSAGEKVGVLCRRQGKFAVVEYSDMPDAAKEETDAQGALCFSAGNLCIHYYSMAFLGGKASPAQLPKAYHVARKAIPYAHPETGATIPKSELTGNTGIKLETFIFDVFEAANSIAALEVVRQQEFAPVKNAPGHANDSPNTARAYLLQQGAAWAAAAGAVVSSDCVVEVSARVSLEGSGLEALSGHQLQGKVAIVSADELPGVVPVDVEWSVGPSGAKTGTAGGVTFVQV